jgi:hypothetical protein
MALQCWPSPAAKLDGPAHASRCSWRWLAGGCGVADHHAIGRTPGKERVSEAHQGGLASARWWMEGGTTDLDDGEGLVVVDIRSCSSVRGRER